MSLLVIQGVFVGAMMVIIGALLGTAIGTMIFRTGDDPPKQGPKSIL